MNRETEQHIYHVGFHLIRPKNKYQLYEFISQTKADSFYESLKAHHNVKDCFIASGVISDPDRYDGKMKAPKMKIIDTFEK